MIGLEKLNYDTIVLGGTLEALIHSYVEGIPLIMVNTQIPFYRDVDPTGLNKSHVWSKLSYYLSYAGLNPLEQKAGSYRLEEDNRVTIFGKTPYKVEIGYNNIIRYDQVSPTEKLRVFDHIYVENLLPSHLDTVNSINTDEDFVNHFYTKVENKTGYIISISSLDQTQVADEQYSEVYARLKTVDILKSHGVVGRVEHVKDGTQRTHYIKTKTLKREVLFDTRKKEDDILVERKETRDLRLKKVVDLFGSPYAA